MPEREIKPGAPGETPSEQQSRLLAHFNWSQLKETPSGQDLAQRQLREIAAAVESTMREPDAVFQTILGRTQVGSSINTARLERYHGIVTAMAEARSFENPDAAFQTLTQLYAGNLDWGSTGGLGYRLLTQGFAMRENPDEFLAGFASMGNARDIAKTALMVLSTPPAGGAAIRPQAVAEGLTLLTHPVSQRALQGEIAVTLGMTRPAMYLTSALTHPEDVRDCITWADGVGSGRFKSPSETVRAVWAENPRANISVSVSPAGAVYVGLMKKGHEEVIKSYGIETSPDKIHRHMHGSIAWSRTDSAFTLKLDDAYVPLHCSGIYDRFIAAAQILAGDVLPEGAPDPRLAFTSEVSGRPQSTEGVMTLSGFVGSGATGRNFVEDMKGRPWVEVRSPEDIGDSGFLVRTSDGRLMAHNSGSATYAMGLLTGGGDYCSFARDPDSGQIVLSAQYIKHYNRIGDGIPSNPGVIAAELRRRGVTGYGK